LSVFDGEPIDLVSQSLYLGSQRVASTLLQQLNHSGQNNHQQTSKPNFHSHSQRRMINERVTMPDISGEGLKLLVASLPRNAQRINTAPSSPRRKPGPQRMRRIVLV